MNILLIPSFFKDYRNPMSGSFFLEQAVALCEHGHRVYMLYPDTYSIKYLKDFINYIEPQREEIHGVTIYRKRVFCPFKHGINGFHTLFAKTCEELFDAYIKDRVSIGIIHAHNCVWAGYAAKHLSEKYNIPYVITEHSSLYGYGGQRITEVLDDAISKSFACASKVICVSGYLRSSIKKYRNDAEVIGNLVDTNLFCTQNADYGNGNFVFLCVGFLPNLERMKIKGVDLLLEAFANVLKIHPQVSLKIIGIDETASDIKKYTVRLNIQEKVTLLTKMSREQIALEMRKCSCYVMPSRYETFGLVYAEAMASGLPVIATKVGAFIDIVTSASGYACNIGDVNALTANMVAMIEQYDQYNHELIRQQIVDNYSKTAIVKKLEEAYSSLV